jgi:membrane protease YdiL (CAAX protease family)
VEIPAAPVTASSRLTRLADRWLGDRAPGTRPSHAELIALAIAAPVLLLCIRFGFDHASAPRWFCDVGPTDSAESRAWATLMPSLWWALGSVACYMLIPLAVWRLVFRVSLADMGLGVAGLRKHGWIYLVSLVVIAPVVFVASYAEEFQHTYPFFRSAHVAWGPLIAWELAYVAQFVGLEAFFRGWMIQRLKPVCGHLAIAFMLCPYVMIHFNKPLLEAVGSIGAGLFLGLVAYRTNSIWGGVFLHVSVAIGMDFLSLWQRGALPQ